MSSITQQEALETGMTLAYFAAQRPNKMALVTEHGDRTWQELNGRVNQLARLLRSHGIGTGDAIALVMKNRPEFVEGYQAANRIGVRFTPANFHLTAEEVGYVIDNCEAKAVLYDASLASAAEAVKFAPNCTLRLAIGGSIAGFVDYENALKDFDNSNIEHPSRGGSMLYTSGTTGRPKGVFRKPGPLPPPTATQTAASYIPETDMNLCTGPAYHAAPLAFNVIGPLTAGVGVVMMDKWDAEQTLALIEKYKITHTHMVATMFHRIVSLSEDMRRKYNLSSLRYLLHGAAPTPVHLKRSIIDWLGPIVFEYYAATEGGGGYFIDSPTWLAKPGSVGRSPQPENTRVMDDEGNDVAQGNVGFLYFRAPEVGRFEYFKSPEKTGESYRGAWFTLGDMGYLDNEGFLFLTGRSAETIISGGVNIYPQEIDNELLKHPAVQDVCTVGVPNEEWGEEVKSVVQLNAGFVGSAALSQEIIDFARARLPGFKTPRSIDFQTQLPRMPSGKIQRRLVRTPYWAGRTKQI